MPLTRQQLIQAAHDAANKYGLRPGLFIRQIKQESNFNAGARSPKGAGGIAQIMPATARAWHVNTADPLASLDVAAKNMAQLVAKHGEEGALRAYNAGEGAIEKSKGYAETNNYVKTILGGLGTATPQQRGAVAHASSLVAGGTKQDTKAAILDVFAAHKPGSKLKQLDSLLSSGAYDSSTLAASQPAARSVATGTGGDLAQQLTERANKIDVQHLPYSWGGGHAGKTTPGTGVPVDCSGAVSSVLGIDPRVAAQFKTWGSPGAGSGNGVVIYAKDSHVIMEINGHFFGTSASNPGGGAGWIPRAQISPSYLAGFTARHAASAG